MALIIDQSKHLAGEILGSQSTGILAAALSAAWVWGALRAVGAVAALEWVARRLAGVAVTVARLDSDLTMVLPAYLAAHGRRVRVGDAYYLMAWPFVRRESMSRGVGYERESAGSNLYLLGRAPVLFHHPEAKRDDAPSFTSLLVCLRGTVDLDRLVADAVEWHAAERRRSGRGRRFYVDTWSGTAGEANLADGDESKPPMGEMTGCRPLGFGPDDLGEHDEADPTAHLALTAEQMAIVEEVRAWASDRDWHAERGIPWGLRYLFAGPPGTGKSSLARAAAKAADIPVYQLDLGTYRNRELRRAWKKIANNAPAMVLIEDVGGVFRGRENVTKIPGSVTFDCLLGCIDGVDRADGICLVVTDNHPELLDPALGQADPSDPSRTTRPGRCDRVVEFRPFGEAERRAVAARIVDDPAARAALVAAGATDTQAQFSARCVAWARAARATERRRAAG